MIAINNHSFLNVDHFTLNLSTHTPFFKMLKQYIVIIREIRSLQKLLHIMIDNIEAVLELNNIDSVEKIDDILLKLESFSDAVEVQLEDKNMQTWHYFPLRYMLEKITASSMSLQAMLGTQQALIMDKNDTEQNAKV